MKIDLIIEAIEANKILVSHHAREEAEADRLKIDEICLSVIAGEIIKDYPEDKPYPSCLIYGSNDYGQAIHSVWGYNRETGGAVLITVYRPDPARWIDWRIRRN